MSNPDFLVRAATVDDAEQVAILRKRIDKEKTNKNPPLDPYGGNYPSLEQQSEEIQSETRNGIYLVAVSERAFIGIAFCSLDNNRLGTYSLGFVVEKAWRDKKVGTALVSQVVNWGQTHPQIQNLVCRFPKSDKATERILHDLGFKVVRQGWTVYIQGAKYNATEMNLKIRNK